MERTKTQTESKTKEKLLDAACELMLAKGYTAASVDDICAAAGLTKGSFFHYFESKEDLGKALAERVYGSARETFQAAPFRQKKDPLDRILGYVDFLIEMARGKGAARGCLLGTFAQELSDTHPKIRLVCAECFTSWAEDIQKDLEAAKAMYAPRASWSAAGMADHLIAVLEGAIILAKAKQDRKVIETSLVHFKEYLKHMLET